MEQPADESDDPSVLLALELVKAAARSVRDREHELQQARERLDDIIIQARNAGATTVAITAAARMSRTTIHHALTGRTHRKKP